MKNLPIGLFGFTVIKKQTSCFLKFSHSAFISGLTERLTVTSALTLLGRFSPKVK